MSLRGLDPRKLCELLLEIDRDLAAAERGKGCVCGGALHTANFPRKPRGVPGWLGREHVLRFSLCCAQEGCRKRVTAVSTRFLGRRVYVAVVVLLAGLREDLTLPVGVITAPVVRLDLPRDQQRLAETVRRHAPRGLPRTALRTALRVRNERLGDALARLAAGGHVAGEGDTWIRLAVPPHTHIDTTGNGNGNAPGSGG